MGHRGKEGRSCTVTVLRLRQGIRQLIPHIMLTGRLMKYCQILSVIRRYQMDRNPTSHLIWSASYHGLPCNLLSKRPLQEAVPGLILPGPVSYTHLTLPTILRV